MAAKFIRLTHKIAIQLHLVAQSCTICSYRSSDQSGNFWIHHRMYCTLQSTETFFACVEDTQFLPWSCLLKN